MFKSACYATTRLLQSGESRRDAAPVYVYCLCVSVGGVRGLFPLLCLVSLTRIRSGRSVCCFLRGRIALQSQRQRGIGADTSTPYCTITSTIASTTTTTEIEYYHY